MTDLVGRLKAALTRKSERAGRPVLFSARVPGSLDGALAAGLDVRTWIERGLIDVVVVGHATGSRFRLPVEEYVAAARGTDVEVIAQNLGLFMQPRPHWAGLLFGERDYYSTEMCRAVAAVHHRAGAHGLYLFNNHYLSVTRDAGYDRQPWREIADPALIARRDKHYLVDQHGRWAGDGPGGAGASTRRRPRRRRTGHRLIEQLTARDAVAIERRRRPRARRRIHFNCPGPGRRPAPRAVRAGGRPTTASAALSRREVLVRYP